ncbi:MAG: cupin domain-containing protein [Clostridiales bacterium]|nr:cupin domain-containing protein [Clostridiales bacterium]
MNANVVYHADVPVRDLGGGVRRRVLAHNKDMMTVEVSFEKGSEGAAHTHPHCQNTYVLSGRYEFTVDGETVTVAAGDTLAFPPNVVHGTKCLEAGTLIDIFTPMREDFL